MPIGYRFFEEYHDRTHAESLGNVIAVWMMAGPPFVKHGGVCFNAVCASKAPHRPNSAVDATYLEAEYLGTHCKHISEARARAIHPRLFEYLDKLS
ncbi:MAG: hypothetical protein ABR543_07980 [Gemmatimonadaceae bacterium]